jgi:curved DNA-binding protein CbpA
MSNHYETLGVRPDATQDAVKRAFRRAAKKAHSDHHGGSDEEMKRLNAAWAVLGDPAKRAAYDASGFERDGSEAVDERVKDVIAKAMASAIGNHMADIVGHARGRIRGKQESSRALVAEYRLKIRTLTKQRATVLSKADLNIAHELIDDALNRIRAAIENCEKDGDVYVAALAELEHYEYVPPPPEPVNESVSPAFLGFLKATGGR